MSDSSEPNSDPLRDLREVDTHWVLSGGIPSGGDVPEGADTPYKPSVDEFVEGARLAAEANREVAEARAREIEEHARMLFEPQEERQEGEQ
jgi:hypothetical protein